MLPFRPLSILISDPVETGCIFHSPITHWFKSVGMSIREFNAAE